MVKIFILTKRSIFLIFLVSNSINPLLASPLVSASSYQRYQRNILHVDIQNELIGRGLQEDVAILKVKKLFSKDMSFKIAQLYKHPDLNLTKDKVLDALVKYALFDKSFDLNSYDSLLGFVQNIDISLSEKGLNALREIANTKQFS